MSTLPAPPSTLPDVRSLFLGYHYSFAKLPESRCARAPADDAHRPLHDATSSTSPTDCRAFPSQHYVNRWRLEKKDPAAALSEPKQPIVYWLDRNIPVQYREPIKAGILEWNKAFERIGFKDAIRVEVQPDDADFDTADIRHASMRWYRRPRDGVRAPSARRVVDPRTGEILDADIGIDANSFTRRPRRLARRAFAPGRMPHRHAVGDASAASSSACCDYGEQAHQEAAFALSLLEARGDLDAGRPRGRGVRRRPRSRT